VDRPFTARSAAALGLVSAGALGFEITLLRLYAVQHFYHFAFLVISLAVLGTAAGGTVLAMRSRPAQSAWLASGFAASVLVAFGVMQLAPFDSYAIAWDPRQWAILALYLISASLPFFFQGWFTGAALAAAGASPGRAYAANLVGAAAGPPTALLLTTALRLESAVLGAAVLGLVAAAVTADSLRPRLVALSAALALAAVAVARPEALHLRLSPNKPLAQARLYPQAESTLFRDGISSRLEVVESAGVHSFPGLSLNYTDRLPEQVGFFLDGDGPYPATGLDPQQAASRALAGSMPDDLAYRLRPKARVLILRQGAGLEAALALSAGASSIHVAVDEPLIVEALRGPYASLAPDLFSRPSVVWLPTTSRGALARGEHYDVIQFALSDAFRPVASGAFSLAEEYDLTLEAVRAGYRSLSDDGLLVVPRWLTTPPAESLRAWATVIAALRAEGVARPGERLLAFRTLRTSTVIASARPWTPDELTAARDFLERNAFDPVYLPDLRPDEVNRFNRLPADPYPSTFSALLVDPDRVVRASAYRIEPVRDDRPFFFHFFRWRQTPDVIAALGQTWQPFGGSGYLVLLLLLAVILPLALALCLLPSAARQPGGMPRPAVIYFTALGIGFLFVEVALLQRLILPLEQPAIAFAVVVSSLLLFSGIGSRLADRRISRRAPPAIAAATLVLWAALPPLLPRLLTLDLTARLLATIALLAPLGLWMGMPFPAGLARFAADRPGRVGWAWAVNGAVSGVAGVLGTMIALDLGLGALLLGGGAAYLAAWLAWRSSRW